MSEPADEKITVPATFEFSQEQNGLIEDLSWKMRFVGTILAVLGLLVCLTAILSVGPGKGAGVVQGVLFILLGVWTRQAGSSFQIIVDTKGMTFIT